MASDKPVYSLNEAENLFEKFIKEHERKYKDEEDKKIHFEKFKKNLEKINRLNAESPSATFGINKFADYSEEDMKQMMGCRREK